MICVFLAKLVGICLTELLSLFDLLGVPLRLVWHFDLVIICLWSFSEVLDEPHPSPLLREVFGLVLANIRCFTFLLSLEMLHSEAMVEEVEFAVCDVVVRAVRERHDHDLCGCTEAASGDLGVRLHEVFVGEEAHVQYVTVLFSHLKEELELFVVLLVGLLGCQLEYGVLKFIEVGFGPFAYYIGTFRDLKVWIPE